MSFDIRINGEVVKTLDVDPLLILAVNVGTYRVPVDPVHGANLDIGIEWRPATDGDLVEKLTRSAAGFIEDDYNKKLEESGLIPDANLVTETERDLRRSLEDRAEEGQAELDRVEKEGDPATGGLIEDDGSDPREKQEEETNEFEVEEEHENEFA